jgi:CRISPR-associated endonuclease Cas1
MPARILIQERAELAERALDYRRAPAPLRRRGQVYIVQGHGLRVSVARGQLVIVDGAGRGRHERRYTRAGHGLSRLVVLGSTGSVSLEALRWLADLGIAFVHLDRDGRLLTHSAGVELDEPRLRRAQALALTSPAGLTIASAILNDKLLGQRALLDRLLAEQGNREVFDAALEQLQAASSLDELVFAERDAALAYWAAWRQVQVRFRSSDATRVPEHWLRFGQRASLLTGAPRLAVNPANTLLNYLYAILEAETRIGCLVAGLDPGVGIVHADVRARASLALDLMEAVRPRVDAYVLDLLTSRVFRACDFHETRKGNCRVLAPLSHELARTAPGWARLIAPVVERVARVLADAPEARIDRLPTPLSGANRKQGRQGMRRRPSGPVPTRAPMPVPTCRRCGGSLPHPRRVYCDECLPHYQREQYERASYTEGVEEARAHTQTRIDRTHGGIAKERRAERNVQRKRENREWEITYGKVMDMSIFTTDILPRIQGVPLSQLMRATGLSLRYCSQIRRGEKTPHPRHWEALAQIVLAPPGKGRTVAGRTSVLGS